MQLPCPMPRGLAPTAGYPIFVSAAFTNWAISEALGIGGGAVGGGGQEPPPYVLQVLLSDHCKETMYGPSDTVTVALLTQPLKRTREN